MMDLVKLNVSEMIKHQGSSTDIHDRCGTTKYEGSGWQYMRVSAIIKHGRSGKTKYSTSKPEGSGGTL